MDPVIGAVEAAGFVETRRSQVERVERAAEPDRARWNERYVITARCPM